MKFNLPEITEMIEGMPFTYHRLSDSTRVLCLALLGDARERWQWEPELDDTDWNIAETMADLAISEVITTMLIGMIIPYGGEDAPDGFLFCDGTAISRDDYADLFLVIGVMYGHGNGTTTYNLPDLRGRIPAGLDTGQGEFDALGETGGANDHTLETSEIPAHNHSEITAVAEIINGGLEAPAGAALPGVANTGNTGGGGAHNNLQPYQVVNYLIKT